jgi:hypothetical protein
LYAELTVKLLENEVSSVNSYLKIKDVGRCEKVIKRAAVAQLQHLYGHMYEWQSELSRHVSARCRSILSVAAGHHEPLAQSLEGH